MQPTSNAFRRYREPVVAVLAGFLLLVSSLQSQALADEWRWSGVERVVAISDVHGAFDAMTATLKNAGVLNDELGWSGGATHLVLTGDMLDRGPDSRKVMDLMMRLEGEALEAGGRVHVLLGNHEVMNMIGDLRYVSKEEYAAFAGDELAEDRERWFEVYRNSRSATSSDDELRKEYAEKYPPGFFGLRRAFTTKGQYGPWLMSKPLMIVINGTAFVHGGLSPLVAELGLDGVNRELKAQLVGYVTQMGVLMDNGILDPTENFYDHAEILEALPEDPSRPPVIEAAIRAVIDLNGASIHSPNSPLWYRGSVACGPLIEEDKIAAALEAVGADRVVIGHTPTLTRRVLERMDGRVVEIDTGMLNSVYQGSGNALIIEGGALAVVNQDASKVYEPVPHPRRVGYRSERLSAADLEQLLANGSITPTATPESGQTIVNVTHFGQNVAAVFTPDAKGKGFLPDLAAYRLDLLLGLGMVPVTVAREIDGVTGSLQFIPQSAHDDVKRTANREGALAWCPLDEQWQAMYVFDSLIYNQGRRQENMLYSIDNWQLILTDYRQSFSASRGLPTYVANMEIQSGNKLQLSGGWRKALTALSDERVNRQLGDVLDKRRIKALLKRRDDLLKRD